MSYKLGPGYWHLWTMGQWRSFVRRYRRVRHRGVWVEAREGRTFNRLK